MTGFLVRQWGGPGAGHLTHARWWRWLLLAVLLACAAGESLADCRFRGDYFQRTRTINAAIGDLSHAREAPVGTQLWGSGWRGNDSSTVECFGSTVRVRFGWSPPASGCAYLAAAEGQVCNTNLAGIGVQVQWARTGNPAGFTNTWGGTLTDSTTPQSNGAQYEVHDTYRVRLFKTGPISPGTLQLPKGVVGQALYGPLLVNSLNLQIPPATVAVRACTLAQADKVVNLPPSDVQDFLGGAGASVGLTPFTLDLNCDPNIAVSFRLDGPAVDGTTGVLSNASGIGRAGGVGVQVLRNNAPLPLGVTHFHAHSGAGGPVTIVLAARYHKHAIVTPGNVSATATLTMTYQ